MHSHEFSLPQGTIAFSRALPAHICTLVTGGRPVSYTHLTLPTKLEV